MTSLAAYLFGYNLNRIRYPWKGSIESALCLADEVYFCECFSSDDTWEQAQELAAQSFGRLHLMRHSWDGDCTVQVRIANALLAEIDPRFDFAIKLDADEVLCEWSFSKFRSQLDEIKKQNTILARPRYTHFCPDDKTTFPFIYSSKAVVSKTYFNLRFHDNDACALGGPGVPEAQTDLMVFHYGKMAMGREEAALYKERTFTEKYSHLGFPDPKVKAQWGQGWLNYMEVFDVARQRGEFHPYTGQHPIFVQDWLAQRRADHMQFLKENGLNE